MSHHRVQVVVVFVKYAAPSPRKKPQSENTPRQKHRCIGGCSLSCWEGPNLIFRVRGEARRAKPEAERADSGGGVLEEGEARFSCILAAPDGPSCNLLRPSSGGMPPLNPPMSQCKHQVKVPFHCTIIAVRLFLQDSTTTHRHTDTRAFQFGQKKFRFDFRYRIDSIRQSDKFAACTLIFI